MVWGEFILESTAQESTVIEVDISWAADSRFLVRLPPLRNDNVQGLGALRTLCKRRLLGFGKEM